MQSDNTTAACKNGIFGKLLSTVCAMGYVDTATLSCLRTGHSHEDVDAVFGVLAKVLQTCTDLQTPQDVCERGPQP